MMVAVEFAVSVLLTSNVIKMGSVRQSKKRISNPKHVLQAMNVGQVALNAHQSVRFVSMVSAFVRDNVMLVIVVQIMVVA